MKRLLIVFGTRPEAITMAPLISRLREYSEAVDIYVCVTAQHRQMLDQVLGFFDIEPDYDLNLMRAGQTLSTLTADILTKLSPIMEELHPDMVLVHGDTTTSMATALAAFYAGVPVGHVEAGLRTWNKEEPYPEEINRRLTAQIADLHFAPTDRARQNLLREKIDPKAIRVTGNSVIDALQLGLKKINHPGYNNDEIRILETSIPIGREIVLVTGHRRENFGDGLMHICEALCEIARYRENVQVVYPVHLNPNVQEPVTRLLSNHERITLIAPQSYPAFIWLMAHAKIIITDSGGIQEEAPSLGKPVLVTRNTTERPEAVEAGTVVLVGTDKKRIVSETVKLLDDSKLYAQMSQLRNPYGDGHACETIITTLADVLHLHI